MVPPMGQNYYIMVWINECMCFNFVLTGQLKYTSMYFIREPNQTRNQAKNLLIWADFLWIIIKNWKSINCQEWNTWNHTKIENERTFSATYLCKFSHKIHQIKIGKAYGHMLESFKTLSSTKNQNLYLILPWQNVVQWR